MADRVVRAALMLWKQLKRPFKHKEPSNPFLRTVKIFSSSEDRYFEFKMRLDTGCDIHNLITRQVLDKLKVSIDAVAASNEAICLCLNGNELISSGTIALCWKGKGFRKIFETTFHVIDGPDGEELPWQVVLAEKTIDEHKILKFVGFGGSYPILPTGKRKGKEGKAAEAMRRQKHDDEVRKNSKNVEEDMKAKQGKDMNGKEDRDKAKSKR